MMDLTITRALFRDADDSKFESAVTSRVTTLSTWPMALVLGILGAALGFIGSWVPSYWGDEAATVLSADRSWNSLARELTVIDGVHGLYYSGMHVWIHLFGTSELSTRLPSAIAAGLMVAGVVTLVRQFAGIRLAALAGVVAILLPRATSMAMEARSYAAGAAVAVWLTVLLVRALRSRGSRWAWIVYAFCAAAAFYLFLYLGLLLLAHGVYVAVAHRRRLRQWGASACVAMLLAAPILVVGFLQRNQISFLSRRHYATPTNVLVRQWFGSSLVAVVAWSLIVAAAGWAVLALLDRGRAGGAHVSHRRVIELIGLTLLWLVMPTGILLGVDALGVPAYNTRYLAFSTPAAAILIAAGTAALVSQIAHRGRRLAATAAVIVSLIGVAAPVYIAQRQPYAKDGGSDLRAVAAYVGSHAEAGGSVIFDQTTKPSRDPRLAIDLYPAQFTQLDDIALVRPAASRAAIWDEVVPNRAALAQAPAGSDVWAVELRKGSATPEDISMLQSMGYSVASADLIHRTTVYHLVKG